jgi:hypothetical protein
MTRRWLFPALAGAVAAAVAWQGTLVATPFVLMNVAMKRIGESASNGRANVFAFGPMATADRQPIVRPSPDLLYSTCVFNLSQGPVLVDIAPVPGHYWSVSIFDARTDVAAVRSDRDTGGKPAKLALHRPGQSVPAGWEPVPLGYNKGIVLIRILLTDKSEFAAIDAVRRKSSCSAA